MDAPARAATSLAIAEADEGGEHAAVRSAARAGAGCATGQHPAFSPTDLAAAPPWLFVLERRLSLLGGWQARMVALPLAALLAETGRAIEGRALATVSGARLGENYEALAAAREPGGYPSAARSPDDNFTAFQRTLLLSLFWPDEASPVAAAAERA